MERAIKINNADNVAVALQPISADTALSEITPAITINEDIPSGHKFALLDIKAGDPIIKYGYPIGRASADIHAGDWVHVKNVKTNLSEVADYSYNPELSQLAPRSPETFSGYLRANGSAGIRNEIWILPTVGCVNDVCKKLAEEFSSDAKASGLDGIYAFTHPYGCSQMGEDHEATKKILAALAHHPNAGGVLLVGLGCENNIMSDFKKQIGEYDEARTKFIVCQDVPDELEEGRKLINQLIAAASNDKREPIPVSRLVVGMKCGGSDGLSGITANAVVGVFSDKLISMGGSTILTEVPEMFGAEEMLMNRCASKEVYDHMVSMIVDFKDYFTSHNQVVYENPSPGNKDGGITTLEDKSLGCVQKGGTAPVVDVIAYGDAVNKQGLTLLSGPGNDLVSTTALTAAGAQIILFTTGRGTPFGAPAVTLKLSSNSELAEKKPAWIDFNAGSVATGESISDAAERLLEQIFATASGQMLSKAEQNGYREIAIFKNGVTL